MKKFSALRDALCVAGVALLFVFGIAGFISLLYLGQYYLAEPWNNVSAIFLWTLLVIGGASLAAFGLMLSSEGGE